jgi:hypothetical protein
MGDRKPLDFANIVRDMTQSEKRQGDLAIWGGRCAENDLKTFLQQWSLAQMDYRIWEYAGEIAFERDTLPPNVALLERGRLFGEGGDLDLRRDGATFAWRFVGPAGAQPPAGDYGAQDYWDSHLQATFYQSKETALLWGENKNGEWYDDRVGAAQLRYPASGKRVKLDYKTFSRTGRVEFVWFTGLSEWKEADNG